MPSLTELSIDDLRHGEDAVETLIEFRDYLPPGDALLALALTFRDDIRELLGMPVLPRVSRSPGRKPIDGLEDADLGRLNRALVIPRPSSRIT